MGGTGQSLRWEFSKGGGDRLGKLGSWCRINSGGQGAG